MAYGDRQFFETPTKDYNPDFRPVFNRSRPTNVDIEMGLKSIIALDEKREVISCNVYFTVTWEDEFFKWNQSSDKPWSMDVHVSKVWTPTLTLHNSVTDNVEIIADSHPIIVFNHGVMTYSALRRTDTRCKVNISKFPFDQQVCLQQRIFNW